MGARGFERRLTPEQREWLRQEIMKTQWTDVELAALATRVTNVRITKSSLHRFRQRIAPMPKSAELHALELVLEHLTRISDDVRSEIARRRGK